MKKNIKGFGPHLIIDGYGADPQCLEDENLMYAILDELPELIGMNKIDKPNVYKFDQKEIAGISIFGFCVGKSGIINKLFSSFFEKKLVGSVLIVESHISIHTYSKKDCVFIDVFSCKDFDTKKAIDFFEKAYKIKKMDVQVLKRGKKFPVNNLHG